MEGDPSSASQHRVRTGHVCLCASVSPPLSAWEYHSKDDWGDGVVSPAHIEDCEV